MAYSSFRQVLHITSIFMISIMQDKTGTMPEDMRVKAGLDKDDVKNIDIEELREAQDDLFNHLIRADTRAWNRIIDTYRDMLDKR